MSEYDALGLIETRGLAAAIEAADAAIKTANVRLVGITKTVPALMTVQITGETAAVRSGVDAAKAAAERMGEVVSSHVIPRPDGAVARLQGMSLPQGRQTAVRSRKTGPAAAPKRSKTRAPSATISANAPAELASPAPASGKDLESMTVRELRSLARSSSAIGLKGRAIARATKSELLKAFRS